MNFPIASKTYNTRSKGAANLVSPLKSDKDIKTKILQKTLSDRESESDLIQTTLSQLNQPTATFFNPVSSSTGGLNSSLSKSDDNISPSRSARKSVTFDTAQSQRVSGSLFNIHHESSSSSSGKKSSLKENFKKFVNLLSSTKRKPL